MSFSSGLSVLKNTIRYNHLFSGFIRKVKIPNRLLAAFLILSLIPLLITGIFSYNRSNLALKQKIGTSSHQVVMQIGRNIEREMIRLENESIEIQLRNDIQHVLKNYSTLGDWEKSEMQRQINTDLSKKFSLVDDLSSLLICTDVATLFSLFGFESLSMLKDSEFTQNLLKTSSEKNGMSVWSVFKASGSRANICRSVMCRAVKDVQTGQQNGYMLFVLNEKLFLNIYNDVDIGTGSEIFVLNSQGKLISNRNPALWSSKSNFYEILANEIKTNQGNDANIFNFKADSVKYLAVYCPVRNTDWHVVSLIPYSYINKETKSTGVYTLLLGLVCLFGALLFSFTIFRSISIPLNNLMTVMNEVKRGNLSMQITDTHNDEISEVAVNFNNMLGEINRLLESIKSKEQQKRLAEFKALQAQINPHFLSNTLNSIKWMANMQNAENIESLITALIHLLHSSMGKGDELITLKDELEYLKSYLTIQDYRYCDKFKVLFDVPDELMNKKILKFIIQPVIENAIIHGIEPLTHKGLITLKAYQFLDSLKVIVTDNGMGIPEEKIKDISKAKKTLNKSQLNGIGLANVQERIRLYFGENYGMHIESVPGLFTSVELTLPIISGEGENLKEYGDKVECLKS